MNYLVECIPNISIGKNINKTNELIQFLTTIDNDIDILDIQISRSINRSVLTLVGRADQLFTFMTSLYNWAAKNIDMSAHEGIHPCIGAIDICPFVSFDPDNEEDLLKKVYIFSKEISTSLDLPVYQYGKNTKIGNNLSKIRKGGYQLQISPREDLEHKADFGHDYINRKFGATIIGMRSFMIAYNITLKTQNILAVKQIAKNLRKMRENVTLSGGLDIRNVKFLAWYVADYNQCQISTNIYDIDAVNLVDLFDLCHKECTAFDIEILGSELIGMIPQKALDKIKNDYGFSEIQTLNYLNLDLHHKDLSFDHIILERKITL